MIMPMPVFTVYYVGLSDAATEAVNQLGWDKAPGGTAYLNATCFPKAAAIEAAAAAGLYERAAAIGADDAEQVFSLMQNRDTPWTHGRTVLTVYTKRPRSMMVGDIVHDTYTNEWWFCASVGFERIDAPAIAKLVG